jgi:hypothetical protein
LLENCGYDTLHVTVTPADGWIQINRQEWTIKAGKQARIDVSLLNVPSCEAQSHIDVRAMDRVVQIPVHVKE